ncbi:MAG: glycoside hydrolase family 2 protein [Thermoleophilaceae bacterium]
MVIREGNTGRMLLGGRWYFRQDDARTGESSRFYRQRSLSGWSAIRVPHNWNARDTTLDQQSIGWYRKEFRLPRLARRLRKQKLLWRIRFESANAQAKVWLNGRLIGKHIGGYFPFELDLKGLRRHRRNRLVVKVSSVRSTTDLTHWRFFGQGGWWNFGGLLREVYVRPVDRVDIEDVKALPRLRRVRGSARVGVELALRNAGRKDRRVQVAVRIGTKGRRAQRIQFSRKVNARSRRAVRVRFRIRKPSLWRPGRPRLYSLFATASTDGERRSAYRLAFGVRKIQVKGTRVYLNGHRVRLRGASVHEDDPSTGGVFTRAQRRVTLRRLRQLGASVTRSHYPLHPAFIEALDRAGILYWVDSPVYQLSNLLLDQPRVRRSAIRAAQNTVRYNVNHASIFVWSLGNELGGDATEGGRIGSGYADYIRRGARQVHKLDDTRLVGLERNPRIGEQIFQPALGRLDVLGINEYFGWYKDSAFGYRPSKTSDLGPFLDQVHNAYPGLPLFVTEYGAEATRDGSESQRGTFQFQQKFLREHLAIHASKPYVNGSIIWILKDFRVLPNWSGGNDRAYATPPWNNKGLIDQFGAPKPAFSSIGASFRATKPLR